MKRLAVFIFLLLFFSPPVSASSILDHVSGRILIDVENNGEAWWVNPADGRRLSLGRPADALSIMREFGLGVSNENLEKIPELGSTDSFDLALTQRLSGSILLQVEGNGEAWYINPGDLRRYFLGRPADALKVMQQVGLGITSSNLASIPRSGVPAVAHHVPFTPQAPFAEWSDIRQHEGCEEASVLMAMKWVQGKELTREEALKEITAMADYEERVYGSHHDTSAQDTADRLIKGYYGYENFEVRYNINTSDILAALENDSLVLLPVNARLLNNPFFTPPGPFRHMIVVTGYDETTKEFITNEPGTKRGEDYRYDYELLLNALQDYPSGVYVPIPENMPTAMIIIKR